MLRWLPICALLAGCWGKHHDFTSRPVQADPHHPAAQRWSSEPDLPGERIRLLLVGDAGHVKRAEKVQRLLKEACEQAGGCDGVLVLGNNVRSTPWNGQARAYLEEWAGRWEVPVYFAAGNREWAPLYGWVRADRELEHIAYLPRLGVDARGTGHYYGFSAGPLRVDVIDGVDLRKDCGRAKRPKGVCGADSGWRKSVSAEPEGWRLVAVHQAVETLRGPKLKKGQGATALLRSLSADVMASGQGHHLEYRTAKSQALVQSGAAGKRQGLPSGAPGAEWAGRVQTPPRKPAARKLANQRTVTRTAHGGVFVEASATEICVEPVPVARINRRTWSLEGASQARICKTGEGPWPSEGDE